MGINDKAFRLRGLRDRLHLTGRHECTFKQKVEIIIEILGLVHSPRNLSWCRRYTARLREQNPDPTPEQLVLLGVLDDRLFKKAELIKARQERKAGKKKQPEVQPAQPAPAPGTELW